jgi:hypothetical protein
MPGPPPQQLLDAGYCLAAHEHWLGSAQTGRSELELGYAADTKSYRGAELLNVVYYATPIHSQGIVFTFLAKGKERHRIMHLLFRNAFRQSDDGSQQLELVNPPLGGLGTEDQILDAIRKIGFDTYTVPLADLQSRSGSVQCEDETGNH